MTVVSASGFLTASREHSRRSASRRGGPATGVGTAAPTAASGEAEAEESSIALSDFSGEAALASKAVGAAILAGESAIGFSHGDDLDEDDLVTAAASDDASEESALHVGGESEPVVEAETLQSWFRRTKATRLADRRRRGETGAPGRARRSARQRHSDRGESAAGRLDRAALLGARYRAGGPDSGRQHRPDSRGREVRPDARLPLLHLRDLVDSPLYRPRGHQSGADHPYSRLCRRDDHQSRQDEQPAAPAVGPRAADRGSIARDVCDARPGERDHAYRRRAALAGNAGRRQGFRPTLGLHRIANGADARRCRRQHDSSRADRSSAWKRWKTASAMSSAYDMGCMAARRRHWTRSASAFR